MAVNHYFQNGIPMGRRSESLLMEDLIIECLKIYGFDTYYLPRQTVNFDTIFTEDPLNKYDASYMIESYLQNTTGYEGEGDLLSKFGVEIRDSATFIIARRRWDELIGRTGKAQLPERPAEGDVIYMPITKSFFEVRRVEQLNPFFQVGKLYVFKLECELMQNTAERFETGIAEIDDIAADKNIAESDFRIALEDDSGVFLLEYETPSALILESFALEDKTNQVQNENFKEEVFDILDFSEKNPFGEIL